MIFVCAAIPDSQTVMLPFLTLLPTGRFIRLKRFAKFSPLTATIPSGQFTTFDSRVGWARTYLKKAGLIEPVVPGQYRISARGSDLLKSKPSKIDNSLLKQFPEFLAFLKPKSDGQSNGTEAPEQLTEQDEIETPLEVLEGAYQRLRRKLADELLQTVRTVTPTFFEHLMLKVLVARGYGGSLAEAGKAVGKTGDDGIDGIINEDRLGLDFVYIQAKRWAANVGRPEIQSFAGSLEGHRARKGVFITTSQFTKDYREYITRVEKRIVLIDGEQLAQLMMEYGVGVSEVGAYNVKKVDRDFFED